MPNHVTNIVESSQEVIAMLMEDGNPTFKKVSAPHPDLEGYGGIICSAEDAAQSVCGEPFSDNPMLSALQQSNRRSINVADFDDKSFDQFVSFVNNKRKHGYYHIMDFAREEWGTKWGPYGYDEKRSGDNKVVFDTAWSCPFPVFYKLSRKFPDEKITVTYADEDIGSNCGVMTFLGGRVVEETSADNSDVDWVKFACEVTGCDYEEYISDED